MSLAYRFFVVGILFALIGMGLGTYMGMSQDFLYAPVHAHINLVGWATHFLFGLYYRAEPTNAKGALPEVHFWCAVIGGILLPIGIIGAVTGNNTVDLAVIPGTLFTLLSMALFLLVVIRGWRQSASLAGA
jgi:FtsH-binding integral membrane protein